MSAYYSHPIDHPAWDTVATEIGAALLHERAQVPPVVIGQCEEPYHARVMCPTIRRCPRHGFLVALPFLSEERFICPAHGATLDRAVRRWPK